MTIQLSKTGTYRLLSSHKQMWQQECKVCIKVKILIAVKIALFV